MSLSTCQSDPLQSSLPPVELESELNSEDSDDDNHSNDYGSTGSASISDDGFCDEAPITTTTHTTAATTAIMAANAAKKSLSNARRLLYVSRGCYHSSKLVWGQFWLVPLAGGIDRFLEFVLDQCLPGNRASPGHRFGTQIVVED